MVTFTLTRQAMTPLLELARQHGDPRDWLLLLLSPLFMLFVAAEWWRWRKTSIYDWRDSLNSLNIGGSYLLLDVLLVIFAVLPVMNWIYTHRLLTATITPWSFAALYFGVDFCYYLFHRASHRIRWFWCAHVVHHGSEHMNFTTAMRQSWFYTFAGNWLFYTPMVWLGFEPRWVLLALSINLAYQFFVHTQWVDKLPAALEFIFNTPSHHRAHHGRNPQYIDRNYGGTLIIFDRLFGTFVNEDEAVDYGLVHPVSGNNLLWLNAHEWVALFRDISQPDSWWMKFKHAWAPPEWRRTRDNPPHATPRPPRTHRRPAA